MSEDLNGLQANLNEYAQGKMSRRGFLIRAAAVGVGAAAAGQLLAACSTADTGTAASGSAAATGSASAAAGLPVVGGIFREGYDRAPTPPDPVRNAWADPTFNAFFEALLVRDPAGNPVPMLASAYTDEPNKWTFTLRDGLNFHSGTPLTPEIVVENFELFRNAETGQNAIFWNPITGVSSSGQVITCATDHPYAAFQETITTEYCYLINPAARKTAGDKWGSTVIDGTGPFVLESFSPTEVKGLRWKDYPGANSPIFENKGTAYLDGITWVSIVEGSQRAPEIETGNVDAIKNPPPQDVDRLKGNPDLVVQEFQEISNFFLSVNVGNKKLGFDDVRVRQAISHAIDREGIVQSIYLGHAAATYGPCMPGWSMYDPAVEQFNQYDPEGAKKLLDEAGWTVGSDGVREKGGTKLAFTTYQLSDATEVQVMQAVVEQLKQVGIDMTMEALDGSAFFPKLGPTNDSYAFKWLWSSPIDVIAIFGSAFQPPSPPVDEVKAAYEKWQTAGDSETLKAAAGDMQMTVAQNLVIIPIVTPNTIWVNRTNVMGWRPNQANLYPFYNDVWLAV
jgi:peptide/nickel transport system substrate-binding protein